MECVWSLPIALFFSLIMLYVSINHLQFIKQCAVFADRCNLFISLEKLHPFYYFVLYTDYAVQEKPHLSEDMQGGADYIVLKSLDIDSIRIIGSVLGQSIALDYFVSQVIYLST